MNFDRMGLAPGRAALAWLGGCAAVGGTDGASGKTIHTGSNLCAAIGPHSQMVQAGDTCHLSGVVPIDKATNAVQGATIEEPTRLVLDCTGELLEAQGTTHANALMSNVFKKDLNEFGKMNAVYGEYFKTAPPSRAKGRTRAAATRREDRDFGDCRKVTPSSQRTARKGTA